MTRASHLLYFGEIEVFELFIIASIFLTQCFDMIHVVWTAELSDYFLGDIATYIFIII